MIVPVDEIKIIVTLGSIVTLYLLRRNIKKTLGSLLTGGDITKHEGKTFNEIVSSINDKIDEILMK